MALSNILEDAAGRARRAVMQQNYTVPTQNGPGLHTKPVAGPGLNPGKAGGTVSAPALQYPSYPAADQGIAQDIDNWMRSRPVAEIAAPAAATAAPTTTTTTAPATTTNTTNQYPWLDSAFGKYFQAIQQDFADRGLLDSTNKLTPMTELADAYAQRYAQEARTDNQNAVTNAINLWSTLASGQLQLADLARLMGLDANMNLPTQPSIFSSIFNQSYLPPTKGTGQTGDAPTVTRAPGVDTSRGEVVPTYGLSMKNKAFEAEQANAAANRAIQQAYLKLAQDEASKADSDTAKWEQMAADVVQNKLSGKSAPGMNLYPTDLFESFQAAYGIDIAGLVRAGDARAIALVKSAYDDPKVAEAVIARMQGVAAPTTAAAQSGGNGINYPNNNLGSIMRTGDEAAYGMLDDYSRVNPITQRILSGTVSRIFPGRVTSALNLASNLFSGYNWLNSPSK